MKRTLYDKQFKMAQSGDASVLEVAKELGISAAVCAVGLMCTMNMEKVRSQGMGTHFSILPMKLKNWKNELRN